jgi:type VI secretion system protein ImpL
MNAEAARLPEPLHSVVAIVVDEAMRTLIGEEKKNIRGALAALVTQPCMKAIDGRYPFVRTSSTDVTTTDFNRMFAAGGVIDDFFQKNLAPYIDTTVRPWRARQLGQAVLDLPNRTLEQFQRAQTIRNALFAGGPAMALRLEFKPVEMDTTITQFILDVDGQLVKYNHGPQIPVTVQWPGPRGSMQVRLQLSPPIAGRSSGQVFEGPWALFKMLDGAKIESANQPEKFLLTFDIDGRKARFEVLANSVENPFRLEALANFQCPGL